MRILVLVLILCCSAVADENELVTLFKKSVVDAAKDSDEVSLRVRLGYRTTERHLEKGDKIKHGFYDISLRPRMALLKVTQESPEEASYLVGANDTYSFVTTHNSPGFFSHGNETIRRFILNAYYIDRWSLIDLLASKTFNPLHAKRDGRYVEVVFEHEQNGKIPKMTDAYVVCE